MYYIRLSLTYNVLITTCQSHLRIRTNASTCPADIRIQYILRKLKDGPTTDNRVRNNAKWAKIAYEGLEDGVVVG